jgi:hypothetical protein
MIHKPNSKNIDNKDIFKVVNVCSLFFQKKKLSKRLYYTSNESPVIYIIA